MHAILRGAQRALPIVLGYLPIGFAYGVLACKSGLSGWNTIIMSLLVFAGSAQFIAIGLFASGAGVASVIITTFIVNLRHLLMAASLAPFLSRWNKKWQSFFAFELTDETFALHSSAAESLDKSTTEAISLNITAQLSWILGSLIGVVAAGLIGDIKPYGLDFALSAMFIGLLIGQCTDKIRLLTAGIAGVLATILYCIGLEQLYVIIASVVAATVGLGVEEWIKKRSL